MGPFILCFLLSKNKHQKLEQKCDQESSQSFFYLFWHAKTTFKKLKTKNMSEVVNFDGLKKTLNSNKKK